MYYTVVTILVSSSQRGESMMYLCVYVHTKHVNIYIQTHRHIISLAQSITPVPNDIDSDFSKPHSNIGFM
jgi:hypothetical protein